MTEMNPSRVVLCGLVPNRLTTLVLLPTLFMLGCNDVHQPDPFEAPTTSDGGGIPTVSGGADDTTTGSEQQCIAGCSLLQPWGWCQCDGLDHFTTLDMCEPCGDLTCERAPCTWQAKSSSCRCGGLLAPTPYCCEFWDNTDECRCGDVGNEYPNGHCII